MTHQYDSQDEERLPEGFKRIAYDSDSMRFTFQDSNGDLYQGEAGAEYGVLTPMSSLTTSLSHSRPNAFASDSSASSPRRSIHTTFHDILPPNLMTVSSPSAQNPSKTCSTTTPRFVKAVRTSILVQHVVHNLRHLCPSSACWDSESSIVFIILINQASLIPILSRSMVSSICTSIRASLQVIISGWVGVFFLRLGFTWTF